MLTGTGLLHTRESAERRYELIRRRARLSAQRYARLRTRRNFKFKAFDVFAFKAVASQWEPRRRRVAWDWAGQFVYWRKKRPTRWDLAIWLGDELICLALGYASRPGKKILYLAGVERIPGDHPDAQFVLPMVIDATERYARRLGAAEVRILQPHPALEARYAVLGYTYTYDNAKRSTVARREE